jgi:hypothetical protein
MNTTKCGPITPALPKQRWFGLFPFRSPLLRESLLFSFPPGTKMFQFPGCASFRIHSLLHYEGCPIRKSMLPRLFAPRQSLSQLITSFIAIKSQGILHLPLLAYNKTFNSFNISKNFSKLAFLRCTNVQHCGMLWNRTISFWYIYQMLKPLSYQPKFSIS